MPSTTRVSFAESVGTAVVGNAFWGVGFALALFEQARDVPGRRRAPGPDGSHRVNW